MIAVREIITIIIVRVIVTILNRESTRIMKSMGPPKKIKKLAIHTKPTVDCSHAKQPSFGTNRWHPDF
jgi:hypothetical protein